MTVLTVLATLAVSVAAHAGSSDRILMHRNGLRGVAYAQLSVAGAPSSAGNLSGSALRKFALDGDGAVNVRGNLYPVDVDGDGSWEFVHFNGYRIMRVFRQDGTKLWQITNPSGRVHRSWSHRDTLAVIDLNGDRKQEIVHCWVEGGTKLVARNGATGQVIKSVSIPGSGSGSECQIAAFNFADLGKPLILVAGKSTASCKGNFEDTWSGTIAFDTNLNLKWRTNTCSAGHYVWAAESNGQAVSSVFVGKYQINSKGSILCTLPGWGGDHIDSISIGDADPTKAGNEAITVGRSGTRMYSLGSTGKSCTPLWSKGNGDFLNAQYVFFAKLKPGTPGLNIAIREEPTSKAVTHYLYFTDYKGNKIATTRGTYYSKIPMQNANLDGQRGTDELAGAYGEVLGVDGSTRLTRSWYWGLQPLSSSEKSLVPPEQWAARPLWFDINKDGREELITWGRNTLVIGRIN
ncbi:MAG: hypothetical protein U1E45_05625 [Geminicoccaceae bacterium]